MTLTKKHQVVQKQLASKPRAYTFEQAIGLIQNNLPKAKFSESVDIAVVLGIDAKKSDQTVRGSVVLPHGTGKNIIVAVFAQGAKATQALEAGADIVGMQDLADKIQAGDINFNLLIASPDTMGIVGKLGPILGPRGLMPNPKVGTVTMDVANAVKNAKSGQMMYKNDKAGIIQGRVGQINFLQEHLKANIQAVLSSLARSKPMTSKGLYFKKLFISTTMGPALPIDLSSFNLSKI